MMLANDGLLYRLSLNYNYCRLYNNSNMSKGSPFVEESRAEIVKSTINSSTSKNLWSFSKERRFSENKSVCPYVSYLNNGSTISHRKTGFGWGKRRVFSEVSDAPSSWAYHPDEQKPGQVPLFALSRENCIANSYIGLHPEQIPGPGRYISASEDKKKGYTMRPKTANSRTYFIDNKELKLLPSPFEYSVGGALGKQTVSKFRTVTLGNVTMQSKGERFKQYQERTPSPFVYNPKKYAITKFTKGGKIGRCTRLSFIDNAANSSYTPGPGNYKAPTDFGHYKSKASLP